jgi:hypothetical protein
MQTESGTYMATCPMDTMSKTAETWSWLTSIFWWGLDYVLSVTSISLGHYHVIMLKCRCNLSIWRAHIIVFIIMQQLCVTLCTVWDIFNRYAQ